LFLCADYTTKNGLKKGRKHIAFFSPHLITALPFSFPYIARSTCFNDYIETATRFETLLHKEYALQVTHNK
jgi:hypothetical protein